MTSLHSLPVFLRLRGRAVILIGEGDAAEAKRRLLERAGAVVAGENDPAALAIVVDDEAAVLRLKARGVLVNAVDRPDLCDFTLPAIVERGDVIVAVGTGGASAGLAAALRQRIEGWLPARLGDLVAGLRNARAAIRARWPDSGDRRRAIGAALAEGGPLDPLEQRSDIDSWLASDAPSPPALTRFAAPSDPDDLTLAQARALALADHVYHGGDVAPAILDRARADASRIAGAPPAALPAGNHVWLEGR
ncbi:precorrin-2 dehydrogenase/sirohydrochlorin ferrochelatase family protein [Sphingomonas sp.]|uniref:precorrin-2 dehydrogenase/sirohydrochlorin ferrochelatase family protein n=1 Tax=Sphingomonas sp. TaxID=28214 RepID=UPI002DD66066|nr:siroheme synthase [Sphingomonas sp.]